MDFKVVLQKEEINLSSALPLKVRDWRALQKQGITMSSLRDDLGVEKMAVVGGYVLEKAGSKVSVDDLLLSELSELFSVSVRAESMEEADRPT